MIVTAPHSAPHVLHVIPIGVEPRATIALRLPERTPIAAKVFFAGEAAPAGPSVFVEGLPNSVRRSQAELGIGGDYPIAARGREYSSIFAEEPA